MNFWKKLFGHKNEENLSHDTLLSLYAKGEIDEAEFKRRIGSMGIDGMQQLLKDDMARIFSEGITGASRKKK
jgi:hypothetical protein